MHQKYQRGLSLLWTAVFVGGVALVAMVGLMSARYEHNYFAEAWKKLTKTEVGQAVRQVQQGIQPTVKSEAAVRKCVIDGKVVYSNVECDNSNPTSRKVDIHDTKGFEAPKVPVSSAPQEGAPTMQDKMIEKAVQR
ncbi:hypothetical protein EGT07_16330 [Herbaspirillum sp. HC18]|nr:hypothetical protein EGT07_16330 [Herbaspirillum sp. HC18]